MGGKMNWDELGSKNWHLRNEGPKNSEPRALQGRLKSKRGGISMRRWRTTSTRSSTHWMWSRRRQTYQWWQQWLVWSTRLRKIWCNYNGIKLRKKKNGTRHRRYPTRRWSRTGSCGRIPFKLSLNHWLPSDQTITVIFDFNCWSWSLWGRILPEMSDGGLEDHFPF